MRPCSLWFVGIVFNVSIGKNHRVSGPVTSVAREEDVQIFLKDPVQYLHVFLFAFHATPVVHLFPVLCPGCLDNCRRIHTDAKF